MKETDEIRPGHTVTILTGSLAGQAGDVVKTVLSQWNSEPAYDILVSGRIIRYARQDLKKT